MRNIFIASTLALISQSSFAVNSLTCNAQMLGKTQYAPKTFVAPTLVGQGLNAILRATHKTDHLFLNFNAQTVSIAKAHVILDGRYRSIPMNAHLTIEERNNIISISLRDTQTSKKQYFEFDINSNISLSFDNTKAIFELDCVAR